MKTMALVALAGVVAVLAVAGLAVATGPVAQVLSAQTGNGGGSGMMAGQGGGCGGSGMMSGGYMHEYQWAHQSGNYSGYGQCHDYDWNHSYNYDCDGCPRA